VKAFLEAMWTVRRRRFSGKFLSKLPGKERKSGSEAGTRKLGKPRGSRVFILGLPWLSRVGALPKLDVAGSTPVARSKILQQQEALYEVGGIIQNVFCE